MANLVAAYHQSQGHWTQAYEYTYCTLSELPQQVSSMHAGLNIQISQPGIVTESGQAGSQTLGLLVFWTPTADADKVWDCIRSQFLQEDRIRSQFLQGDSIRSQCTQGWLDHAVAIAARKHKADWYIQEYKRPFGECRFTVYLPHMPNTAAQMQAAQSLADLLTGFSMSHIFYVSMAGVAQQDHCLPQAVRLTQPVYQSATHHLVYVQPQTGPATANGQLNSNGNSSRQHMPAADQDRWGSSNGNSNRERTRAAGESTWGNSNSGNISRQRLSAADQSTWNSSNGIGGTGNAHGGTEDAHRGIVGAHGGGSSRQVLSDAEQNLIGSNAELSQFSAVTGSSNSRQRSPGGDAQPQKYCPPHRRQ